MDMNEMIENIGAMLLAQSEAEEKGEHEFTCPLCGGTVKWDRAEGNNHLHLGCGKCGFRMCE